MVISETVGQLQDRHAMMDRLRALASSLDAIDLKLQESREAFERKADELNSTLQRIARAVENMGPV